MAKTAPPELRERLCVFVYGQFCFEEGGAPHQGVSSTVGAPCNEVPLCNRAGWLGLGFHLSSTLWLDMDSSHGVGEYSVTAVWPRAGGLSRRRPHEIIVVVVVVDVGVTAAHAIADTFGQRWHSHVPQQFDQNHKLWPFDIGKTITMQNPFLLLPLPHKYSALCVSRL